MVIKADPRRVLLLFLFFLLLFSSCTGLKPPQATSTPILPTRTPFPPSPTPIPTAAIVNGDFITVAEYQEELARYKASVGRELTETDQTTVINNLINLTLLSQAAVSEGYQLLDEELDEKIAGLDQEDQPLKDWLATYGYTEDSFRIHLKRSLAAAWMRDQIINQIPQDMDQIHAQQMLFYDLFSAESTQKSLDSGKDFIQLARTHDPQTYGDLGWFPQGYLTLPELDDILFNLEVGETSDIIETEIGYHIIIILEKEENRLLDPAIRQVLQEKSLDDWLERRWKLSTIQITLP